MKKCLVRSSQASKLRAPHRMSETFRDRNEAALAEFQDTIGCTSGKQALAREFLAVLRNAPFNDRSKEKISK